MKKQFINPVIDIEIIKDEDVIVTSIFGMRDPGAKYFDYDDFFDNN